MQASPPAKYFRRDSNTYQKCKIHIDNVKVGENPAEYEKEMEGFLSTYGRVVDMKILSNCRIKRDEERVSTGDLLQRLSSAESNPDPSSV